VSRKYPENEFNEPAADKSNYSLCVIRYARPALNQKQNDIDGKFDDHYFPSTNFIASGVLVQWFLVL
jgi:hypothetical protein